MTAAALGATLTMESLDGPQELDVKRGTQSGDTMTLRGLGVTHLRGGGRGDAVVHWIVQTPTRLDPEQAAKIVICNAPIVEGAVIAATEASGGSDLLTVKATAEELSP